MKINKKGYILLESLLAITIASVYTFIILNMSANISRTNNKSIKILENIKYIDCILSDNMKVNSSKRTDQVIYSNQYVNIKIIKLIDCEGQEKYYEKIYIK